MKLNFIRVAVVCVLALAVGKGCGGGGGGSGGTVNMTSQPATGLASIGLFQAVTEQSLTVAEVQGILARAIQEAQARAAPATITVVDRVGNVLAVFKMTGAPDTIEINSGRGNLTGLQALPVDLVPSELSSIAKAVTGAYLSSAGNAFSTRTASFIVQQHFPPGAAGVGFESGPLFGVQFSQLPCSDLSVRFQSDNGGTINTTIGPKRSPLGLSADPGGLPLYKAGVVVGGIGVESDGIYRADLEPIGNRDTDNDEIIAVAGAEGFGPPLNIRAELIPVDGTTLKFVDRELESLLSDPATAPTFASLNGPAGALQTVTGYTAGAVIAGSPFGNVTSGIRPSVGSDGLLGDITGEAFVLADGAGNRFAPRAATDTPAAAPLTLAEVRQLLSSAFSVARDGRAQIRRPLNSRIQVTVSIVDTNGAILGVVRTPDAPIFGTDVSLQKARTAAFFSSAFAGTDLDSAGAAITAAAPGFAVVPTLDTTIAEAGAYVSGRSAATRTFFADPAALTGLIAFADRSGGNISRPYYPDGTPGNPPGPLSRPIADWNIFSTGLQESLIRKDIAQHVAYTLGVTPDIGSGCTDLPTTTGTDLIARKRLANGLQIFPGSVPIYRGGVLIGGIGVSGDGIDQDDMISFLGTDRASTALAGALANAPPAIRADTLLPQGVRLRYVNCPFNPFVGSSAQNVCQGK